MKTNCKLAKLSLNFDMSGMVQPCNLTTWYLKDLKDQRHYNVLTDDVKKIWDSEHRKKLITDHDNGVRNSTCSTCWDSEDAGIKSPRQKFNEELRDFATMPAGVVTHTPVACGTRQIMLWTIKGRHSRNI